MAISLALSQKIRNIKRAMKAGESVDISLKYVPTEKQALFHEDKTEIVLFGGSLGGGKSYATGADAAMYALEYPGASIAIFRKTSASVRQVFADGVFSKILPNSIYSYNENKKRLEFINGSFIYLLSLEKTTDFNKYQGEAWDYLSIDEVTLFREQDIIKLMSRCRSPERAGGVKFPRRIRFTANPGGPSHAHIKRIFLDRAFNEGEDPDQYSFIPSKITDNKYLMEDTGYMKTLQAMPEALRRKYLDGDWSVGEGVFLDRFNPMVTIIQPFEIPKHWRRYRALDYGYSDTTVVGWFAISPSGTHYMYRELAVNKMVVEEIATKIKQLSEGENIIATLVDPSVFSESGIIKSHAYRSIGLVFNKHGVPLTRANNDRILGGMMMREYLSPIEVVSSESGEVSLRTKLMIFNGCKDTINTIPHLISDPENPDDIEHGRGKKQNDHCFVGNTIIKTTNGDKQIKDIEPGDMVYSLLGPKPVFKQWVNGENKVLDYTIRAGTIDICITCTPNHKILTQRGSVPISKLTTKDVIYLQQDSTGKSIFSEREINISAKVGGRGYTELPGSSIKGKSQKDTISTTKTKIASTTESKISNALVQKSICHTTLRNGQKRTHGTGQDLWKQTKTSVESGIKARLEKLGINKTTRTEVLKTLITEMEFASNVLKSIDGRLQETDSAQIIASLNGGERLESITKKEFVKVATRFLFATSTQTPQLAPVAVEEITAENERVEKTYNLTVLGCHSYAIQQGLIVLNSFDCIRYYLTSHSGRVETYLDAPQQGFLSQRDRLDDRELLDQLVMREQADERPRSIQDFLNKKGPSVFSDAKSMLEKEIVRYDNIKTNNFL